jgi:hypothetical protein
MRSTFANIPLVPASGTSVAAGSIPLVRARTLSITTRLYMGAGLDADTVVYVYYSPDGNNWDTIQLTSWAMAFTASTTKQVTKVLNVPEHGYIQIRITNGSAAGTLTDVKFWYTIQSWDEIDAFFNERLMKRAAERQLQEETGQSV